MTHTAAIADAPLARSRARLSAIPLALSLTDRGENVWLELNEHC
jgi:hypothetical protein